MATTLDHITSSSIDTLSGSWKQLKATGDYESQAGSILFQNLFQRCPEAQELFGFSRELFPDISELVESRRFAMHSMFLIEMIDVTIGILDSKDTSKLGQTLKDIGKKHTTYGVKPEYFPYMTDSLIAMMNKKLGNAFTDKEETAWKDVFGILVENIVEAQRELALEQAARNKAVVTATWQKFGKKNFKEGGVILFKHLFEICPEAKPLFGFPMSMDTSTETLVNSKRFMTHAFFLVSMIDKTVKLLGVDNETLSNELTKLGQMHVTYGVMPEHFPKMTDAIIYMLQKKLGDEFTRADAKAWHELLGALISDMIKGQRRLSKGLASVNKADVTRTWRLVCEHKNYEEHCGVILFKDLFDRLPQAKPLFGFPIDMDVSNVSQSRRFLTHASFLIEMIEKALNMLGEDDAELEKMLITLGEKHEAYGVLPEYFPHMQDSIIHMLKEVLGVRFTEKEQFAWEEVLKALVSDMTKAQRKVAMTKAAGEVAV